MEETKTKPDRVIADAVRKGLFRSVKTLPSWLFYDEEGDSIFQQIMRMPEYYPTRCEYDILTRHKHDLLFHFRRNTPEFQVIELGAGDGLKSEILLAHFLEQGANFKYIPVDISANALNILSQRLLAKLPGLQIQLQNKSYDEVLTDLRGSEKRTIILFMGANIGNFTIREALQFLKQLVRSLRSDDLMLVGFDLKKDPRIIQEAYDDARGLTARFNLNILKRLNKELGAQFNLDQFSHYPSYDPESGATKSFLISLRDQTVHVEAFGRSVHFYEWEPIQTEVSQKYDTYMIEKLMALAGLKIEETFMDADHYFCDVLLRSA